MVLLAFTLVIAGLLTAFNGTIIRFYEGYPWRYGRIGCYKVSRQKQRFCTSEARIRGVRTLLRCMAKEDENSPDHDKIRIWWQQMHWHHLQSFPTYASDILPTRLGNAIRGFESYPDSQYGIEAITLWPRLVGVVEQEYANAISDSKAPFDFMIHSSVLNAVLCLATSFIGLFFAERTFASLDTARTWLIEVLFFGLATYFFYEASIPCAKAWGQMVKGAFDLYRYPLLAQLGFHQTPMTKRERRELWDDISLQMLYGDRPEGPRPSGYASQRTSAQGTSREAALSITGSLQPRTDNDEIMVEFVARNNDRIREIKDLIITDTLPDGFEYF